MDRPIIILSGLTPGDLGKTLLSPAMQESGNREGTIIMRVGGSVSVQFDGCTHFAEWLGRLNQLAREAVAELAAKAEVAE